MELHEELSQLFFGGVLTKKQREAQEKADKASDEARARTREQVMFQKYGLTKEGFKRLWVEASGLCEICGVKMHSVHIPDSEQEGTEKCHIDHCHESGEVRGLLCTRCNVGLGYFKDEQRRLKNAIAYLERPTTGFSNPTGMTLKALEIKAREAKSPLGLDSYNRPKRLGHQKAGESKAEYERRKALWNGATEAEAEKAYIDKVNSDRTSWRIHLKRQGRDPDKEKREKIEIS